LLTGVLRVHEVRGSNPGPENQTQRCKRGSPTSKRLRHIFVLPLRYTEMNPVISLRFTAMF